MIRALLALLLIGCATSHGATDGRPPERTTPEDEVRRAAIAVDEEDKVLRFNPVGCNCPPWEVLLSGRWVRVAVEGTDEPDSVASELARRARADLDRNGVARFEVRGDLSTRPEVCGQGALYLTLSVDDVLTP